MKFHPQHKNTTVNSSPLALLFYSVSFNSALLSSQEVPSSASSTTCTAWFACVEQEAIPKNNHTEQNQDRNENLFLESLENHFALSFHPPTKGMGKKPVNQKAPFVVRRCGRRGTRTGREKEEGEEIVTGGDY